MTRYSYPYAIENGGGERLVFLRRVPGALGERLEGENFVSPGAGPPMHVHHLQEEALTVVSGRIGFQRAGEPAQFAGPGEQVVFKAGDAHKFWNAGQDVLHCTAYIEPADNIEFFLGELFASTSRNGGRRPGLFDVAYLQTRYRSEFGMLEIPVLVQRLLFPCIVVLGRVLGKYRRFAHAPEPVYANGRTSGSALSGGREAGGATS
jgi:quercetin dioxygenase-like cupin family protein